MELNIDHVIIEATRKCNMNCEHCLRGDAQKRTIDNKYIYKMLHLIDNISTLTISGGEPTLAMDTLEYIRECIAYGICEVQNFYMVSNGKAIPVAKLAKWISDMYYTCSDNELSTVGFSFDRFHTSIFNWKQNIKQKRNFDRLQEILEYEYCITKNACEAGLVSKHTNEKLNYDNLISEGRAANIGCRSNTVDVFETYEYENVITFSDNELYLSCSGYIVAGCDWSYKSIDNREDIRIAHIDEINNTEDLIAAIKVYNDKTNKAYNKIA